MTADAAPSRVRDVLAELGIEADPQLLVLSLTHRSWAYENGGADNNERLEFLGDAILGVVVTEHLYTAFPDLPEGRLAKLRAAVVNTHALADVARGLGLGDHLLLGKGEMATGGADKDSILADATEALIAALFLSAGRDAADRFVRRLFEPVVARASELGHGMDWKTSLQELCAERGLPVPHYEHQASGPDHDKRFDAYAVVGDERYPGFVGRSKKQAEQGAAERAFCLVQDSTLPPGADS